MTTRIGVLSDSHVQSLEGLPQKLKETLSDVDLIVHAGDFVALKVYEDLRRLGDVKAVRGNMDEGDVRALLPEKEQLVIEGKKVGIIHGFGAPWGIEERIRARFDEIDVIIYGHSHISKNEVIDGVCFFNPGPAKRSCGILEIGDSIKGTIVKYE
jgi:putative phosphoesterase